MTRLGIREVEAGNRAQSDTNLQVTLVLTGSSYEEGLKKQPSRTREQLNKSPTLLEYKYPADVLAAKRHEYGVQAVEVATSKGTQ